MKNILPPWLQSIQVNCCLVDRLEGLFRTIDGSDDATVSLETLPVPTQLQRPRRALGQCNVTSLLVQDLCGGEILKTEAPGGWHFYDRVDGERHDLNASQFATYADIASTRAEALAGTRAERYAALKAPGRGVSNPSTAGRH
jgi:hypothetical protein